MTGNANQTLSLKKDEQPQIRLSLTRLEPTGQDRILNLVGKLLHAIDLLDRLLALLDELIKLVVHRQPAFNEIVGLVFGDSESSLDGFLSGPIFPVSLSLDKDLQTTACQPSTSPLLICSSHASSPSWS